MNREDEHNDPKLEQALSEIRTEPVEPETVEAAAGRVWQRLSEGSIRASISTCADFQALVPAWRAGALLAARALLLEDHLHECVHCRKAAQPAAPLPMMIPPMTRRTALPWRRWAMAAALAVTGGAGAWMVWERVASSPVAVRASVESLDGRLFQLTRAGIRPLRIGDPVEGGGELRTAGDSRALVRLADGSRIEVRERSALELAATRRDFTIRMERGGIIVEAARRRSGKMYVATRDCRVAVTGTVFSVASGVKGSRVSVLEGQVEVSQGRDRKVLGAGQQFASSPSLAAVAVNEEIAWSRNREAHLALLREFAALEKKLEQIAMPRPRYSSRLLDRMPESTVLYASIPNLGPALGEAQQILRQRMQESPVLRQWWEQAGGADFSRALDELRAASDYLGEEIVLGASTEARRLSAPVFLAEVKRPGLAEYLRSKWTGRMGGMSDHVVVSDNLVAISPNPAQLRRLAASMVATGDAKGDAKGAFARTPFHAAIASAYRDGAGFLFSADLEKIAGRHLPQLPDLKYVVVEQKQHADATTLRAVATFRGARKGPAAWLAKPAPMGALDFVSPQASFAAGTVVVNPATLVDMLFAELESKVPDFSAKLAELEAKLGLSIRNDLAGPLGSELVLAVDGPLFPVPSWELAVEVWDQGRLQWAIDKLVGVYNQEAAGHGGPQMRSSQETIGGRTYYTLAVADPSAPVAEAHYTYVDGYLLAAASRALLDRAIQYRSTGYTLARSASFRSLLPRDPYTHFSAVVYHNLGPAIASVAEKAGQLGVALPTDVKPALFALYGEEDRIELVTNGSLLGLSLNHLSGIHGPLGLMELLRMGKKGTSAGSASSR